MNQSPAPPDTDRIDSASTRELARRSWRIHLGRQVPDDLRAQLAAGTLPEAVHVTAARYPDRSALDVDGVSFTHGELDRRAASTAGWLREAEVRAGDRVLISGGSSMAMVAAYLGTLRSGATAVLANPALTEGELRHIVDDSAPRLAFAADRPLQALGRIAADGRWLRRVVDLGELLSPISPLGIELAAAEPAPPAPPADHGAAVLAYTSGTTGAPKAVPLTHANLLSSIRAVMLAWRWDEEDVLAHALPLFHQHGLGGVHATLLSGSRAVIHARLDPAALCGAIAQHGATLLLAVPATYQRLLSWEHIAEADLSSLRLLVSGSAPLSPALAERVQALLGALPLERYGTTESGLDVSNPYAGERRIGTVGLPLPGMELAIVNDDGRPREDGEDGEIVVRGPQVFSGYRGDDHATAAAFYPEGWFRTGDIGRLDPADGYLQITGRAKDLIITGGLNVYPREVELALEEAPSIVRAAVVGVPSERWGEEVVAAAVPSTGADVDPDAVLAFARTRLAAYKCPKRLVVVEELPLNAMGKVVTAEVVRLMSGRGPTR